MAYVHRCAVIARIAIDQQLATTVGSHMTQSHGGEFSMIVFLERAVFGKILRTQQHTRKYQRAKTSEPDLSMKTKTYYCGGPKSPVNELWLTVASIALVAAIGFVVLSLAVQWWDLTREPDNGD